MLAYATLAIGGQRQLAFYVENVITKSVTKRTVSAQVKYVKPVGVEPNVMNLCVPMVCVDRKVSVYCRANVLAQNCTHRATKW